MLRDDSTDPGRRRLRHATCSGNHLGTVKLQHWKGASHEGDQLSWRHWLSRLPLAL